MWISPLCLKPLDCNRTGGESRFLPRLFQIGLLSGEAIIGTSVFAVAQSGTPAPTGESTRAIIDQLLSFIYSLGHLIGEGIVHLVTMILPSMPVPTELVDPIGLLAILTIFLVAVQVARKLTWIIVIVGWALILVRLIIVIVQSYV